MPASDQARADRGAVPEVIGSRWTKISAVLAAGALLGGVVYDAIALGLLAAATLLNAGLTFAHYRRDGRVPTIRWRIRQLRGISRRRLLIAVILSVVVVLQAIVSADPAVFGGITAVLVWLGVSLIG